jgi:peptidoglycan/LPS O-acetylase OafA/YrhL
MAVTLESIPAPAGDAPPGAAAGDHKAGARIPCLDGLRALSMGLVLFAHSTGTEGFFSYPFFLPVGDLGNLGVRVFFIISGFLITSLLLHEVRKTGRISLGGFYLRRAFRIFPAFYVYLAALAALAALAVVDARPIDFIHAATYTMNFVRDRAWVVGHIWSLSVEEQFYMLWPVALAAVIALAPREPLADAAERVRRAALRISVAVLILAPLARIGTYELFPAERPLIGEAFPTIADSIAFGCLLAALRVRLGKSKAYMRMLGSRVFLLTPVLIFAVNHLAMHARAFFLVGETLLDLMIALCIDRAVRLPDGRVGRMLNGRLLSWIGTLSYSLYLWQQPFLNRHEHGIFHRFPVTIACAFALAVASFYLVEQPMLRLRARLERREKPEPVAVIVAPPP